MRILEGEFTSILPHKMSIKNLRTDCSCNIITLKEMQGGRLQFLMEAKCLKHIIKYIQWKMSNTAVSMNGIKLTYLGIDP